MNYELKFPYTGDLVVADQENVLNAIDLNSKIFNGPETPLKRKAMAPCWLAHLVGDIHQPLHTVSLFSKQFPDGDRGGNSFWIKPNGAVKLHSYWDGLLGRSTKVRDVLNEMVLIKANHRKDLEGSELDAAIWSKESFKLAKEAVYLNGDLRGGMSKETALQPPESYRKESKKVGEQRIALAGYRLAATIQDILAKRN